MESKRVLFVAHTVAMGGANHSLLQLMLELRDNYQVEPVVLMPRIPKTFQHRNLYQACQHYRIECFSLRFYWFKNERRLKSLLCCLANVVCYPMVWYRMRGQRFDIVHSNSSVTSMGAFLSRRMKIPHIWHLREFGKSDFGFVSLLGKSYERWVYRHGEVFVAISKAVKEYFVPVIDAGKVRMIYNGVVPPATVRKVKESSEQVRFCMVGMLTSTKNQLEAIEAVNILVNELGETSFHLTFIGHESESYTRQLREFATRYQLTAYVSFLGERNDVSQLLNQMDVGLMLSTNEAFGRVTVEYLMHGMAVIASDSGANCEIVDDGLTGLIYQLGDCHDLAKKMAMLIHDKSLIERFAESGRERAFSDFTSARNTMQIAEIYQELTSSNHPQPSERP